MNNIVKALIDTSKPDTVEFQFLPGHEIEIHSIISYDKMNGVQFRVESVSSDNRITCTILKSDIYMVIKYFLPNTMFFTIVRSTGEYVGHVKWVTVPETTSNDDGIVKFS